MKIKNFKALAATKIRKAALQIAEAGLGAIDTETIIFKNVRLAGETLFIKKEKIYLKKINRLFVVGVGKCSLEAGAALEHILGEKITGGIIVDVHQGSLAKIKTYAGTHPLPSPINIDVTKEIIQLLSALNKDDLIIFIISGGGSTLLCQPESLTCYDEANIVTCLFNSGASIKQINTIRKHLSFARGGFLAKYAYPAKVVSLIFSDVPNGNMHFIASGPTIKDTTTAQDAQKIISKYDIKNRCSLADLNLIETPKEKMYFKNVKNILLVSNKTALKAMTREAKSLGFKTKIKTAKLCGEAKEVGQKIINDLKKSQTNDVLLYGGETTVTIKGAGKGGRNQELALGALRSVKKNQLILSLASDGRDNSRVAGAICDIITKEKARKLNLDTEEYLRQNNSYEFFMKTGDNILTGDTGSNVSDLIIAIKN